MLIVDDDVDELERMAKYLSSFSLDGVSIDISLANGLEAAKHLIDREAPFAAIFTDLSMAMPYDGAVLVNYVRTMEKCRATRIAIVTDSLKDYSREDFLRIDACGVIEKAGLDAAGLHAELSNMLDDYEYLEVIAQAREIVKKHRADFNALHGPVKSGADSPIKVLVVDDDPEDLELVCLGMQDAAAVMGVTLSMHTALSQDDALAQLELHPDMAIALLDIRMHSPTAGYRLAESIREAGYSKVRLAFISSLERVGDPCATIQHQDISEVLAKRNLNVEAATSLLSGMLEEFRVLTAEA